MQAGVSQNRLRKRLLALLAAFGLFSVASAAATIYGTQWYMARAIRDFEEAIGRTSRADRLELSLHQQVLLLSALSSGQDSAARPYLAARDEFQTLLRQVADFSTTSLGESPWRSAAAAAEQFAAESDRCLEAIQNGNLAEARTLIEGRIEASFLPELETRLRTARTELDEWFRRSSRELSAGFGRVLAVTSAVALLAAGLVVAGTVLIHRWLMRPIRELQRATAGFALGRLSERVSLSEGDELGALGQSMNEMAASLSRANLELLASEKKHRLLFQNLRDAVVLVDENMIVVEYHDTDTGLLGMEGIEHVGRRLLEVWPAWGDAGCMWEAVVSAAIHEGRRYRAMDLELPSNTADRRPSMVDLLVFPVEFGDKRHAAIVLRDVTERAFLQRRVRQAETMEAVGTLAGGLAHDFNNLLAGAIGNLSLLESELTSERLAERIRSVIQTCWQASGLSRRLLNFAGSAHGNPQVLHVCDAVRTILASLDPSFLEGVQLTTDLDEPAAVRMDRDQFTQSMLNLLRNAREAMPNGGRLSVNVDTVHARHPDGGQTEQLFAVLAVSDTGSGMTRDVQARIFEPFFTTKSRASHRGRGMGLAVVYAAVRNAGGFIRVESQPQGGTTFYLYLPVCESLFPPADAPCDGRAGGAILILEPDPGLRNVMSETLRRQGYEVLSASDEQEAVWLRQTHPAVYLVIVDDALPEPAWRRLLKEQDGGEGSAGLILVGAGIEPGGLSEIGVRLVGRLRTPFEIESLVRLVGEAWRTVAPHASGAV